MELDRKIRAISMLRLFVVDYRSQSLGNYMHSLDDGDFEQDQPTAKRATAAAQRMAQCTEGTPSQFGHRFCKQEGRYNWLGMQTFRTYEAFVTDKE
jgi:hypothetical protein